MMLDTIDAFDDDQPVDDGHELIRFMNEWREASARRDVAALDAMLSDELVITSSDGRVLTKPEYLATIRSMPADFLATPTDQTARILDDTGIIRAVYRVEMNGEVIHLRTTATFIKRAEKWTAVAVHSNAIANAHSN